MASNVHRESDFRCSSLQLILLQKTAKSSSIIFPSKFRQSQLPSLSINKSNKRGIYSLCDVSYNNIKRITRMRARSGAIHSDSEESFTQLAEISANQTGIFYDEKLNRRIRAQLSNKRDPQFSGTARANSRGRDDAIKPKNSFLGFDFDIEFEVVRQEREELQRMNQLDRKEVNIAVLTQDPRETIEHLRVAFGEAAPSEYSLRGVDLVVNAVDSTIYKYWVFSNPEQTHQDPILSLYLTRCSLVLEVSHCQASFVKCNVETLQMQQRILGNLTY